MIKNEHFNMRINIKNKRNIYGFTPLDSKHLTGFTLAETIISISLLVMLVFFMAVIVPPLIMKFRASAFKDQTLLLAKNKLEEYIYCAQSEDITAQTGAFGQPYEKFYYEIRIADYDTGNKLKQVTVITWGPSANPNLKPNLVTLTALVKIGSSSGGAGLPQYVTSWNITSPGRGPGLGYYTVGMYLAATDPTNHAFIRVDNDGYAYIVTKNPSTYKWELTKYSQTGAPITSINLNSYNIYGMSLWKTGKKLYTLTETGMQEWDINGQDNIVSKGKVLGNSFSRNMPAYDASNMPANPFTTALPGVFDVDEEGNFYVYSGYTRYTWKYEWWGRRQVRTRVDTKFYGVMKIDRNGNKVNNPATGAPAAWPLPYAGYGYYYDMLNDIRVVAPNDFYAINTIGSSTSEFSHCKSTGGGTPMAKATRQYGLNWDYLKDSNYVDEGPNSIADIVPSWSRTSIFDPFTMAISPDGEVFSGGATIYNSDITMDARNHYTKPHPVTGTEFYRFKIRDNDTNNPGFGDKYFSAEARFGYNINNEETQKYGGFKNAVVSADVSPDGKYLYVVDLEKVVVLKLKD